MKSMPQAVTDAPALSTQEKKRKRKPSPVRVDVEEASSEASTPEEQRQLKREIQGKYVDRIIPNVGRDPKLIEIIILEVQSL